ncbi:adenylate/guanylate cyclase domain-containing protein [Coleofasciculus sp. LEGE 07081]|nr:adenylate/guanylate cyclase domain-containing protein [Coleofasciculus sp. LEGE 07081]
MLRQRLEDLKKRTGANLVTIDAIKKWLFQSTLLQRLRINPYYIAEDSDCNVEKIISELLYGVKAGVFDLHWDVHCPHCNMITAEFNNLGNASALSFCQMCARSFEIDFLERVEVTFSLNKEIEDPKISPVCAPPPILKAKFQLVTPLNETDSATVILEKGRYRYCCPLTCAKGILVVEGEETEELQELCIKQLEGKHFDKSQLTVCPGKVRVELTNIGHSLSGMIMHIDELPDELTLEQLPPRLSGLQLLHFPDYKCLFGEQVLSSRERMKVRSVTIMFTDITGSTWMYETLGDAKAYNIVRDHFEILFQAIEQHGGTVVKTIGDAVMASFLSNAQAMEAAADALLEFRNYNKNRPESEQIQVKFGIHRGSAVLVNLNDRLDYFGSVVNKAARIQSVSRSYEISFSDEVYSDKSFLAALRATGVSGIQKHYEDLKGLKGRQVVYTTRIDIEELIPLVNILI